MSTQKVTVLAHSDYRRALWKNGLGHTDEIAIYPEGAELRRGDFLWRLSSAQIEQSSPFSAFPAHDRTLVVLKGRGLRLTHQYEEGGESETIDLPPLQAYDFPGDVPSRCELVAGPITDLSVFARKAEVEALTETLELAAGDETPWVPSGRWNFVHVCEGMIEARSPLESRAWSVGPRDTLRVELSEPAPEDEPYLIRATTASAKLVFVSLQS